MRISVKGRYALAAVITIAEEATRSRNVSVNNIAESLGISKIYLEQVFAQLKKAKLLTSVKGPKGGYQLAKSPSKITAWEVLTALELSLIEKPESTVGDSAPEIEMALQTLVFEPLDETIKEKLSDITLRNLLDFVEGQDSSRAFMLNM
ncbi:MAG: Rrf2 family transcriptional regulator [Clostridiales Family XIII bacterium]|jgi:Rrf2 family protein|nr:Rrf2 family transcriptional regulator [Clostridiales Family XIII bacterium]